MGERLDELKQRMAELADLGHASSLANWDQQTKMPPRGAEARAESLATLTRISHELFVDDETGRLLDDSAAELEAAGGDSDPDSDDVRLVALVRRQWNKARRVPPELAAEMTRAASTGQDAWISARETGNFEAFAPHLERNFELARRYVECHAGSDGFQCPYDVLLDDYEPQMPTSEVVRLFDELKLGLIPLIARVTAAGGGGDPALVHGAFPVDRQRALVGDVVGLMGFDDAAWRIDDTVHPFASRIGVGDIRITVRWDEEYFPMGLYGAMHECGHGLYEAGLPRAHRRSPLGAVESLGMHESQSRLWENMVGRGRAFSDVLAPRIAQLGIDRLAGVGAEDLYRAVNLVKPSFIRVEADEATYGLHVILRFELEQELIDGTLSVRDLPEAWNARFEEYFGLKVPGNAEGVLQDVHWAAGLIGYFPTYALGNLIAGQLWALAHDEIPDLEAHIAAGELGSLRDFLGRHVHRYGAKFTTNELLVRELGGPMSVPPFLDYLRHKLADVYRIDLAS
jgi:carboxypeptidase Taq